MGKQKSAWHAWHVMLCWLEATAEGPSTWWEIDWVPMEKNNSPKRLNDFWIIWHTPSSFCWKEIQKKLVQRDPSFCWCGNWCFRKDQQKVHQVEFLVPWVHAVFFKRPTQTLTTHHPLFLSELHDKNLNHHQIS